MQLGSLFKKSAKALFKRVVRLHHGCDIFLGVYEAMSAIRDKVENEQLSISVRTKLLDTTFNLLQNKSTSPCSEHPVEALQLKQVIDQKKDRAAHDLMVQACLCALTEMKRETLAEQKGFSSKTEFDRHGDAFGGSIGRIIVLSQDLPMPEKEMKAATSLGRHIWAIHVLGKAKKDFSAHAVTSFPRDVLCPNKQSVFLKETPSAQLMAEKAAQEMHDHLVSSQNDYAILARRMPDRVSRFVVATCVSLARQGFTDLQKGQLPCPSKKHAICDGLKASL